MESLFGPVCPGSFCAYQADFELKPTCPSACGVLRSKIHTTMLDSCLFLCKSLAI